MGEQPTIISHKAFETLSWWLIHKHFTQGIRDRHSTGCCTFILFPSCTKKYLKEFAQLPSSWSPGCEIGVSESKVWTCAKYFETYCSRKPKNELRGGYPTQNRSKICENRSKICENRGLDWSRGLSGRSWESFWLQDLPGTAKRGQMAKMYPKLGGQNSHFA